MLLQSIQVGIPKEIEFNGERVLSGIWKHPVPGPVRVGTFNIEGDGQADLKYHGGRDKAVYGYATSIYTQWRELRPTDEFPNGAMGENLSFDELDESSIMVGDVFQLGSCRLQAVQPRNPCAKLGMKFKDMKIVKQFMEVGRPGIYFAVVEEGTIRPGDRMEILSRALGSASIQVLFDHYRGKKCSPDQAKALLAQPCLPDYWRKKLETVNHSTK